MKSSMDQAENLDYNINFLTGINWFLVSNYKQATDFFLIAIVETDPSDEHYSIYQSYAGLSSVLMHQLGGLHHCYHSFDVSLSIKPEIHLNLACAEFMSGHRKLGIQIIDKIDGLNLSSRNSKETLAFFDLVGKREKDAKGLLKRNKLTHKFIGRIFRKRKDVSIERIEAFIKETTKNRYKNTMINFQSQPH